MSKSTELQMRMSPIKTGDYFEQVLIDSKTYQGHWYPAMLVHIDTFWEGKDADNIIYNALNKGDVIEVNVRFSLI